MIMDTSELHSRVREDLDIYSERLETIHTTTNIKAGFKDTDDESEDDPELSEILRLIECPVCKDVPNPPIYNCSNGHFVCNSCRTQLISQNCACCFAEFTRMRNYPLEALVTYPTVKCDFTKFGCSQKRLSLSEYDEHVRKCWGKLWRPGKVILKSEMPQESQDLSKNCSSDEMELSSPCPRCNNENPPRKVKCQTCDCSLRVPTPMFLSFGYDDMSSSCGSDFELKLQLL